MKNRFLIAVAAIALPLAACDNDTEAPVAEDATVPADTMPAPTDTMAGAEMPTTAQEFVDMAAASDMYEIQAAQLAQDMGTSQEVKDFAQQMITDHTDSTQKLKDAAAEAQPALTVNPQLTPEQQSNLDALRNAGDNFDQVYAQQQVAAHEKAVSLLQGYSQNGDVEPLKTFASNTLPVIQGHLDMARDLP